MQLNIVEQTWQKGLNDEESSSHQQGFFESYKTDFETAVVVEWLE